jgi:hypothetical protein
VLLVAAGCGGEERGAAPQLPGPLAERLAVRSETVAARLEAGDGCGARAEAEALQAETIEAVNGRRVPQRFQEELLASVNELVASIECAPPAPAEPSGGEDDEDDDHDEDEDEDEDDDEKGKGKKKDTKKGKRR